MKSPAIKIINGTAITDEIVEKAIWAWWGAVPRDNPSWYPDEDQVCHMRDALEAVAVDIIASGRDP
jgi:hypothetical protein